MAKRPKKVLAVKFGNYSGGTSTARIGVVIDADENNLDIQQAKELLNFTQLTGVIEASAKKAAKGQGSLIPDQFPKLEAVFDVKGFRVVRETYTLGLTFNLNAIDTNMLSQIAQKRGKLSIMEITDIPAKGSSSDEEEDGADEEDQVEEDDE